MNPSDEVEVAHIERAVRAAGQGHRGKQHHVPGCTVAARTTGDTPVEAIAHYSADDRRLLGEEDVLPVSLVQDPLGERKAINSLKAVITTSDVIPHIHMISSQWQSMNMISFFELSLLATFLFSFFLM